MSLNLYQEKRNFSRTSEPTSKVEKQVKNRFVIQKHQANQLHYDFRLEIGGVLKSWAIPKGIPPEAGVRRLAIEVEDHPPDYIDFTGIIPEGEYGAGTVEIWDKGSYEMKNQTPNFLEFNLKGRKLAGEFALIRMADKNWLLIRRKNKTSAAKASQVSL
jgi:bifunctional non-homologous end joining protein LigD